MWDRKIIKAWAKQDLAGIRYGTALLVTWLTGVIGGLIPFLFQYAFQIQYANRYYVYLEFPNTWEEFIPNGVHSLFTGEENCWALYWFFGILAIVNLFFVKNIFRIGQTTFYLQLQQGQGRCRDGFAGIASGYGRRISAMATTVLTIMLWGLLFVVPGIIKALEYSMVPWLLAENPTMTGQEARAISRRMTRGEKGAIFVLYLSFLGWFLLANLAAQLPMSLINVLLFARTGFYWGASMGGNLAIGLLSALTVSLVLPYVQATNARLYRFLRDRDGMYQSAAVYGGSVNLL
ncbi:MAG: DUF975 family protein [Acutalibacteraceae bacterium]